MAKRRKSRVRAIVGVLVVLVLAAVAGTIFVLDYHQARTNAKDKKNEVALQKAALGVQIVGTVRSVTPAAITIKLPGNRVRRLLLRADTLTENAKSGNVNDVAKGMRGFVRSVAGTPRVVREILVLPPTSRIGQPVLGVGFGLVWLSSNGRAGPKLTMVDAMVDHAVTATRADITVGTKVIVHAQNVGTKPVRTVATEIVLLPSNSAFVG